MKRKLFFLLERLKISQNERRAVFTLLAVLAVLTLVNAVIKPASPFDREDYTALDRHFAAQTARMKTKTNRLMAKYHGQKLQATRLDTSSKDTLDHKKETANSKSGGHLLVDVNTADAKTLQKLHGIGPTYARRIIAYRHKNGFFKTKQELLKIKGIGKKRLAKIKPFIKLTVQQ